MQHSFDTDRSYRQLHIPSQSVVQTGTYRPPSEAASMLLQVSIGCPWNECRFCGMYEGEKYSVRSLRQLRSDIDASRAYYEKVGMMDIVKSLFLQNANAIAAPTKNLVGGISYARERFELERVTAYSSSMILARKPKSHLPEVAQAGLDRLHVGMETASDYLLQFFRKGTTSAEHVKAGLRAKEAGITLSEYVMFGLGGKKRSQMHIEDTARALSEINPDVIRARRYKGPEEGELYDDLMADGFERLGDREIIQEWRMLIELFKGESSFTTDGFNDPIDLHGKLPEDKQEMLDTIDLILR